MPLVINSKFNPFTYDELVKPLQEQTAYQRELEERIDQYADNADAIMAELNPETDAEAYAEYQNYMDSLNAVADNLTRHGLNQFSTKDVSTLRRLYTKKINPIRVGIEAKKKAIEQWDARRANDDTLLGDNPRTHSVADYMNGKTPSSFTLSGNLIASHAKNLATASSSRRTAEDEIALKMGGQYFAIRQSQGYTEQEALALAAQDLLQTPGIKDYLGNMLGALGADNLNEADHTRAEQFAALGFMEGLTGSVKTEYQKNLGYLNPLEQVQLAKLLATTDGDDTPTTGIPEANIVRRQTVGKNFMHYKNDKEFLEEFYKNKELFNRYGKSITLPDGRVVNSYIEVIDAIGESAERYARATTSGLVNSATYGISKKRPLTSSTDLPDAYKIQEGDKENYEFLKKLKIPNRNLNEIRERYDIPKDIPVNEWGKYIEDNSNNIYAVDAPRALLGSHESANMEKAMDALITRISNALDTTDKRDIKKGNTDYGQIFIRTPEGVRREVNLKNLLEWSTGSSTTGKNEHKISNAVEVSIEMADLVDKTITVTVSDSNGKKVDLAVPQSMLGDYAEVINGPRISGVRISDLVPMGINEGLLMRYKPTGKVIDDHKEYESEQLENMIMRAISSATLAKLGIKDKMDN